jgi:transposase InsO family protein
VQISQVGSGTVKVRTAEGMLLTLNDVMHVPDAELWYFSVTVLLEKKGQIIFEDMGFAIYLGSMCLTSSYCDGQLFWFDTSISAVNAHMRAMLPAELWHQRMGHMSYPALLRYKDSVKGITLDSSINPDQAPCPGCELGKQMWLPFPTLHKQLDHQLQIIHSDLAGLMQEQSIQGVKYIATFIDNYSKHGVVYFLCIKDQCVAAFKKFLAWAENQTSDKLLALHSDCGGEYLVHAVKAILDDKGIEHCLTMLGSPQQNGLAEQWNRTIMEKARAMLHSAGLSLGFWEFAVDTAVHIYNRIPSWTINWRMPHELWSAGHTPDVSYFCVFGCEAYVHVPEDKRKKLDPRSIEMTLVGYKPSSKGYWLWNRSTQAIILSHNVTFDERSFPFKERQSDNAPALQPSVLDGLVTITFPTREPIVPAPLPEMPQNTVVPSRDTTAFFTPPSRPPQNTPPLRPCPVQIDTSLPSPSFGPPPAPPALPRLRPNPHPNLHYTGPDNVMCMPSRQHNGRIGHTELLATAKEPPPVMFQEAMNSNLASDWQEACQYEMDALAKNGTWELVDLPPGHKAIKSKWVFKRKADGHFRTRVVAKGFTQIQGIDYDETFSPVA